MPQRVNTYPLDARSLGGCLHDTQQVTRLDSMPQRGREHKVLVGPPQSSGPRLRISPSSVPCG